MSDYERSDERERGETEVVRAEVGPTAVASPFIIHSTSQLQLRVQLQLASLLSLLSLPVITPSDKV